MVFYLHLRSTRVPGKLKITFEYDFLTDRKYYNLTLDLWV